MTQTGFQVHILAIIRDTTNNQLCDTIFQSKPKSTERSDDLVFSDSTLNSNTFEPFSYTHL